MRKAVSVLVQGLAVAVLTYWSATFVLSGASGFAESSRLSMLVGSIVFGTVLIASAVVYSLNRRRSRLLRIMGLVVTVLAAITISPWVLGGIQDLLGSTCVGFFAEPQSCVDTWKLVVFLALVNPIVFPILETVISTLLIAGIWQTVKARRPD